MDKKVLVPVAICILLLSSCEKDYLDDNFSSQNVKELLYFNYISEISLEADSNTFTEVWIRIDEEADLENDTITLNTSMGYFPNDDTSIQIPLNSERIGKTFLKSTVETGQARITARIKNLVADTSVQFVKALPHELLLSPSLVTTMTDSITLNIDLIRSSGLTGENLLVELSHYPLDTTGISLDVQDILMVENGSLEFTVYNPLQWKKSFVLIAEIQSNDGSLVTDSTQIIFE